jgi:hypothetical protein
VVIPALPLLLGLVYPKHDTLSRFQVFSYVYSSLSESGEFPLWVPYLDLGQTLSVFGMSTNGPSQYLIMLLGLLFGVDNDLILYGVSLVLVQFVLVSGLVLFCREICLDGSETFFICLSAGLLSDPVFQVDFNYLIYVPFPMFLWFLLRFSRTGDVIYVIWMLSFGAAFLLFGQTTYLAIFTIYIISFWTLACIAIYWPRFYGYWIDSTFDLITIPDVRNFVSLRTIVFAVLIIETTVLLFLFYFLTNDVLGNLSVDSPGRDPLTGKVDLTSYLTYGGFVGLEKYVELFSGPRHTYDFSLFVGKIVVSCALFSLIYFQRLTVNERRSILFTGFGVIVVICFTAPDAVPLAQVLYYLPFMPVVRHVGYFGPIVKIFLVIMAVIGLRAVVRVARPYMIAAAVVGLSLFNPDAISIWIAILAGIVLVVLRGRPLAMAMLVFAVAEMSFHAAIIMQWNLTQGQAVHSAETIRSPRVARFAPERTKPEESARLRDYVAQTSPHIVRYGFEAAFLKEDFCYPSARWDVAVKGVAAFSRAIQRGPDDAPETAALYGCHGPKLRFARRVVWAGDDAEAIKLLAAKVESKSFDEVVLTGSKVDGTVASLDDQGIRVEGFSANRLAVHVDNPTEESAWLIYADGAHPWWTASIDGRSTELYRADVAFKAVRVPPGRHLVEFRIGFWPRFLAFVQALALAFAQIVFVVAVLCAIYARPEPKSGRSSESG